MFVILPYFLLKGKVWWYREQCVLPVGNVFTVTNMVFSFQGERGEHGPPGPAGFPGAPVSMNI
jgi:hypothetical protein